MIGLNLSFIRLLLFLLDLFLLLLVLPLLIPVLPLPLAIILPVPILTLLRLGLILLAPDHHLDRRILDPRHRPVLLLLEYPLKLTRKIIVLQILIKSLLSLHKAVTLI